MTGDDRDLRERFAVLRGWEEAQTPEFTAQKVFRSEPNRRRLPGKLIAAAACLIAIAAAGLWFWSFSHRPHLEAGKSVASITEWRPATDFLLDTPGRELLGTVPSIGALQDSLIAPANRHGNPRVRKQIPR